ncbi:polysaccharide deacetylase family protein [Paenibacillus agilis]|uniref:ChbG/HpnK family deacetylase n=1 Tax=Paenibacillus agilis TaxID=3020863 RepID=A0A559J352_9BACL|nr:polysaccharide deacetylase family protein [Paenibacillus agilis]TVX94320.1 ChbG/HpnK family deacetylase [Paenibacillus agilis]
MNGAERLGYSPHDRLLIINADDFGMCHSVNAAIKQLLTEQVISSATVMMPCPWAKDAVSWAASHPSYDVGVHLTFTSEWDSYKWGPVNRSGTTLSLVDDLGHFPEHCLAVEERANPEELRAEMISQIEMAIRAGLVPSHLDNHMGSVYGLASGQDFLNIVFDVCVQYQLPFRMPQHGTAIPPILQPLAQERAELGLSKGVYILDDLIGLPYTGQHGDTYDGVKAQMIALLRSITAGLTEMILHPAIVTDELKSITPHWERRGMEFELFRDPDVQQVIHEEGIQLIKWSEVRDAQRRSAP